MTATFAKEFRRGTTAVYASKHFKDGRERYTQRQLRANFFGPRDWYLETRQQMLENDTRLVGNFKSVNNPLQLKAKQAGAVNDIAEQAIPEKLKQRAVYPAILKEQVDDHGRFDPIRKVSPQAMAKYRQFRQAHALLDPSSEFATEERIIDSWAYWCNGLKRRMGGLQPRRMTYGGLTIKLFDQFARQSPKFPPQSEGMSAEAYLLAKSLHENCNPFLVSGDLDFNNYLNGQAEEVESTSTAVDQKSPVDSSLLVHIVDACKTQEDLTQILPASVERWRWLCMGHINNQFQEPSRALSDQIISKLVLSNLNGVAYTMLKNKHMYKLSPSVSSFELIMVRQAELIQQLSQDQQHLADVPAVEELPVPPVLQQSATKKRLARKDYPFKQAPRFYFYNVKMPFVLNPEPQSQFFTSELPSLPNDNETKRLLPDDQRKLLKMMIDQAEKEQNHIDNQRRESRVMHEVTQLYEMYHLMTSDNPRCYNLKPSEKIVSAIKSTATFSDECQKRYELFTQD
ncbi:hypothetical protein MIR68_001983 [Amoeboaphelidium protococcarum]|nr:hypothetical protein MIR68_001983 [Amoeboaphelidium protococcarum]